jgi:hypothetical protein
MTSLIGRDTNRPARHRRRLYLPGTFAIEMLPRDQRRAAVFAVRPDLNIGV